MKEVNNFNKNCEEVMIKLKDKKFLWYNETLTLSILLQFASALKKERKIDLTPNKTWTPFLAFL